MMRSTSSTAISRTTRDMSALSPTTPLRWAVRHSGSVPEQAHCHRRVDPCAVVRTDGSRLTRRLPDGVPSVLPRCGEPQVSDYAIVNLLELDDSVGGRVPGMEG